MMPTTPLRLVRKDAAAGSGWYPISSAIARTRSTVRVLTPEVFADNDRDTVET
jgi:hypothetical protein